MKRIYSVSHSPAEFTSIRRAMSYARDLARAYRHEVIRVYRSYDGTTYTALCGYSYTDKLRKLIA